MSLHNLSDDGTLIAGSVIPSEHERKLLPLLASIVGARWAGALLTTFGADGLARASAEDLVCLGGLPEAVARLLVLVRETGMLLARVSTRKVTSSRDALALLPLGFEREETETLAAIALSTHLVVKGVLFLAKGGSFALTTTARDILAPLVRQRAAGFILVHNHPGGDPNPSEEDVAFTNRLAAAAFLLGLPLVDHVIVATGGSVSFADMGLLPTPSELEDMSLSAQMPKP